MGGCEQTTEDPVICSPMSRGKIATPSTLKLQGSPLPASASSNVFFADQILGGFVFLRHTFFILYPTAKMTERLKSIVAQISPSTSGLSAMYASQYNPSICHG